MAFASLNLGNLNGFSYFHDLERIYLWPPPPRLTHLQCFLQRASLYYRAGLKLLYLLSLLQLQNERSFWLLFQVSPNLGRWEGGSGVRGHMQQKLWLTCFCGVLKRPVPGFDLTWPRGSKTVPSTLGSLTVLPSCVVFLETLLNLLLYLYLSIYTPTYKLYYWIAKKFHLSFSVGCYGKTWLNILANLIQYVFT